MQNHLIGVYVSINKIKRGYYSVDYQLITQKPKENLRKNYKKFVFF